MAIGFDALTDGTSVAVSGLTAGQYSVLGWVLLASDINTYGGIVSLENSAGGPTCGLFTKVDGTTLTCWDQAGNEPGIGSVSAAIATWYRFAITVGAGTTALYVGTGAAALTKASAVQSQSTNPNRLCLGTSLYNDWFDGRLAAVKVYNATLTDDEVDLELGQYVPRRLADLVAWYPLVNDVRDYSGQGRDQAAGATATTVEDGPPIPWGPLRPQLVRAA